MDIKYVVSSFESNSGSTFKKLARWRYNVDFDSSNVLDVQNKLIQLRHNILNNITGHEVGQPISIQDVDQIIDLLNKMVDHYKALTGSQHINSNLKTYTIAETIRQSETNTNETAKELAKTVLNTVLKGFKTDKKLTYKEKVEARADEIAKQNKLDIIKKTFNTKTKGTL